MLELALKAEIPVIGVHTDDPVNRQRVLQSIAGVKVLPFSPAIKTLAAGVYFTNDPSIVDEAVYLKFYKESHTLVVFNPLPSDLIMDCGTLPTPVSLLYSLLEDFVDPGKALSLAPVLKGLSLKKADDVLRIARATGDLSPTAVRRVRGQLGETVQGLSPVDVGFDFYEFPQKLQAWLDLNKAYFLNPKTPHKLVPRGILLDGTPGVGKTMSAKAIARYFGIPLLRLDIAASLNRYLGESENHVRRALALLEREAPCVVLLDEVEKIFNDKDDAVTQRIMSQLLWWLMEHQSRVIVVMTTNDMSKIPPELYRKGRVDLVMKIPRMTLTDARTFALRVYASMMNAQPIGPRLMQITTALKATGYDDFSHAEVAELIYMLIKQHNWLNTI